MPAEIAIDLMVGGRIPQRKVAGVDSGLLNAFPQRGHMVSQALSRVDDNVLIREAQRGNRVAFEELVRQYDQAVLRLALRLSSLRSPRGCQSWLRWPACAAAGNCGRSRRRPLPRRRGGQVSERLL